MRRLGVVLALLLVVTPALATDESIRRPLPATAPFACEEVALDMAACGTPPDLATCPTVCTVPTDPNEDPVCVPLPLPELPALARVAPDQGIFRQALVTGGPYRGAVLALVSLNASADVVFIKARDQLCKAPPLPPPPPRPKPPKPTPPANDPDDDTPPPPVTSGSGPGLVGPNPGLVGGNPGIVGVTPRFR
jgi:hypothetical protein